MFRLIFFFCLVTGLAGLFFWLLNSTEENKKFLRIIMYFFLITLLFLSIIFIISLQEVKAILEVLKDLF